MQFDDFIVVFLKGIIKEILTKISVEVAKKNEECHKLSKSETIRLSSVHASTAKPHETL